MVDKSYEGAFACGLIQPFNLFLDSLEEHTYSMREG